MDGGTFGMYVCRGVKLACYNVAAVVQLQHRHCRFSMWKSLLGDPTTLGDVLIPEGLPDGPCEYVE